MNIHTFKKSVLYVNYKHILIYNIKVTFAMYAEANSFVVVVDEKLVYHWIQASTTVHCKLLQTESQY